MKKKKNINASGKKLRETQKNKKQKTVYFIKKWCDTIEKTLTVIHINSKVLIINKQGKKSWNMETTNKRLSKKLKNIMRQ